MARTIKVRVPITVTIDVEAWTLEYGIDPGDVRDDARTYITSLVRDHLADLGLTPTTN